MSERPPFLNLPSRRAALGAIGAFGAAFCSGGAFVRAASYEVTHSDAEWRKILSPEQYAVLRQSATELAFSSPLDKETRPGTYLCAGCRLTLFDSSTKYDSGTGWPSFFRPLPDAVATSVDKSLFEMRNEVHCRRCGGHLGHVFDDGPRPTGLRYCMNGVALIFVARA
jgi:peptide-methionine (R)-S-oxide reductase